MVTVAGTTAAAAQCEIHASSKFDLFEAFVANIIRHSSSRLTFLAAIGGLFDRLNSDDHGDADQRLTRLQLALAFGSPMEDAASASRRRAATNLLHWDSS
jgi:hypothetical protein